MFTNLISQDPDRRPGKITTLSYPDKTFEGKIDKIDNMLDPDNKVMHARIKIENPGNLLKPGMFANILIKAKSGESLPEVVHMHWFLTMIKTM